MPHAKRDNAESHTDTADAAGADEGHPPTQRPVCSTLSHRCDRLSGSSTEAGRARKGDNILGRGMLWTTDNWPYIKFVSCRNVHSYPMASARDAVDDEHGRGSKIVSCYIRTLWPARGTPLCTTDD